MAAGQQTGGHGAATSRTCREGTAERGDQNVAGGCRSDLQENKCWEGIGIKAVKEVDK